MYRKGILIFFAVLVGASAIYALMDHKEVTTSSDEAYKAYQRAQDYENKLYSVEAMMEYEKAVQSDPQFAMALAKLAAYHMELKNNKDEYEKLK